MQNAIEAMLAASVLLITAGSTAMVAGKIVEGGVMMVIGTALIFLRGQIKNQ